MHVCPAHMIGYTSSTAFIQPIVSIASKCGLRIEVHMPQKKVSQHCITCYLDFKSFKSVVHNNRRKHSSILIVGVM